MNQIWKLCLTLGLFLLVFVSVATVVISCDCGGQTGGFFCGGGDGDDDDDGTDEGDDGGVDAAVGPEQTALDLATPTPFGTSASEVLQKVSESTSAVLQWQLRGESVSETNATITISYANGPITFVDYDDAVVCRSDLKGCDVLSIPVTVHIKTDDGSFDDTWQATLEAYGSGTMRVRSSPLDLSQMNGTYNGQIMLNSVCTAEVSADNYERFYLTIAINYQGASVQGTIDGMAKPKAGTSPESVAFCKGGVVARWQSE